MTNSDEPIDIDDVEGGHIPNESNEGPAFATPRMIVACSMYECTNIHTYRERVQLESGIVLDVPICDECDSEGYLDE